MLQVLSLVAMEPPASVDQDELRDRKLAALRAVRLLDPEDVARWTRRARYAAGRLSGTGGAEDRERPRVGRRGGRGP
jgi:glucose-6-phosphate 1-dehydrogenase